MECRSYSIEEFSPELAVAGSFARLRSYCRTMCGGKKLPAVIICPGGGYEVRSFGESEPAALAFVSAGIQAFVLGYSLKPKKYPQQLLELAAAMTFVKKHAEEFSIDSSRIAVCGFSAGGHLAGCLANLWDEDFLSETLGVTSDFLRPNAAILCYPVITAKFGSLSHANIGVSYEDNPELSLENSVSDKTPPCFIWHTADDDLVSVDHSILMMEALKKAGRPFEMHIFPYGPHAMSVATPFGSRSEDYIDSHVAKWMELCTDWLNNVV